MHFLYGTNNYLIYESYLLLVKNNRKELVNLNNILIS